MLALLFALSLAQAAVPVEPEVTERYMAEANPDPAVERALESELGQGQTSYLYNYVDLNGDGTDEVLALLTRPSPCGTGGCPLYVLEQDNEAYRVLSEITLVQGPVLVSEQPKAWRDLIVGVGGGGAPFGYRVLTYQAEGGYPSNPTVPPAVTLAEPVRAVSYLIPPQRGSASSALAVKKPPRNARVTDGSWRWTATTDPVSGTTGISDPDAYRLTFRLAKLEVVTPCLTASLPYSLTAGALRVEVDDASCAAYPLSAELLESLRAARLVSVRDGTLLIDLLADGGTLVFRR